ncbi:MAG: AsmA family protein [Thermodesulfobacteriota bacterium]
MKKFLIGFAVFAGLILTLLIILPFVINIKDIVVAQIPAVEKQIHRKIAIGDVKLTLLTGIGAEIQNVSISNHPDFRKEAFVSMESLRARVRLMPLLKKTVAISSISIVKPDILLEKDQKGRMNFTDMIPAKDNKDSAEAQQTGTRPPEPSMDLPALLGTFQVANLSIKDARFRFFDASNPKAAKEYALDRLTLSLDAAYSPEEIRLELDSDVHVIVGDLFPKDSGVPLSIQCATMLRKDEVRIEQMKMVLGQMVFNAAARIQGLTKPNIDAKLDLSPTSLEDLAEVLPLLSPLALKGELTLTDFRATGTVDELKALKGVSGTVSLRNGGVTPAALGKTIEKIQLAAALAGKDLKVQELAFQVGDSDIRIDAAVQNILKPDVSFQLTSSYLDVDGLLPPPAKPAPDQGEKEPAREQGTSPKAPDIKVNGRVAVKKCKVKGMQLDDLTAEIAYADAVAVLKKLRFATFGGVVSTSGRVDLTDMETPRWSIDLGTENISANSALSNFTSLKDTLYGNVNTRLSLQGVGKDWSSISKSMDGKGSADIVDGKLTSINLLDEVGQSLAGFQGLGLLAQTLSPREGKQTGETVFQDLAGKFAILGGKIRLDSLSIAARDFLLSGGGDIGLDKALDLRTSVVLSEALSARLEKDNYMKHLLNKDKRLEIPCAISGQIMKPAVAADGDSLNRMLQKAAVNAAKGQLQQGLEKKLGKDAGNLLQGLFD